LAALNLEPLNFEPSTFDLPQPSTLAYPRILGAAIGTTMPSIPKTWRFYRNAGADSGPGEELRLAPIDIAVTAEKVISAKRTQFFPAHARTPQKTNPIFHPTVRRADAR
jgi:hypothetical protein